MKLAGAGSTFLFPVGHQNVSHLILILTDPAGPSDIVVATAVVSEKSFTDKTVTLNVGDHPFIRWPSNVDYGWSRFLPAKKLIRRTPQQDLKMKSWLSCVPAYLRHPIQRTSWSVIVVRFSSRWTTRAKLDNCSPPAGISEAY